MEPLPERIETDNLVIRLWEPDDVPTWAATVTANVEHLRPYMAWIAHEPLAPQARAELAVDWRRGWAAGGDAVYGVFHQGQVAGGAGLHYRIGPGGLEIGYWIASAFLRRGYASEVSRALTRVALDQPGIDRVEIHHDQSNTASAGIPAKLGYVRGEDIERAPEAPGETGVHWIWYTTPDLWTD